MHIPGQPQFCEFLYQVQVDNFEKALFLSIFIKELEIKTFGLVLEFEMSFQQQRYSVAFMLVYSDLGGCWDVSFLPEVVT